MSAKDQKNGFSLKNFLIALTTRKPVLTIIIVGVIVFFNGIFNNFISDDFPQIVNNPKIHSIINIPTYFFGGTFYTGSNTLTGAYYKPVLSSFFSVIYTFFGPNYNAYHFFQIALFIVNSCLVFLFFSNFFRKDIALLFSLFFLVHPINSEVAFYISDSQEVLFFFFGILAINKLLRLENKKNLWIVLILLLLSLLSKETGILFLTISIIFVFLYKRRFLTLVLSFSVLLLLVYFILRAVSVAFLTPPLNAPIATLNLSARILNIPQILFFYLKTFVFPLNLAYSYQWVIRQANFIDFFLPLIISNVVFLAMIYFAIQLYAKKSYPQFKNYLFFLIWFIFGLILHLQIIPLDATVADRWFYFAMVGLIGMIGVSFQVFRSETKNKLFLTVFVVLIILLSIRTFVRSSDWRNEYTLLSHDVKFSDAYDLEYGLAARLLEQGKLDEALIYAEKSVNSYGYTGNYITLGNVYLAKGEYEKSKEAYLNALSYGESSSVYDQLVLLSIVRGDKPEESIKFTRSALSKFPADPKLWTLLSVLEYRANNINAAKDAISKAFSLSPNEENTSLYYKMMNGQKIDVIFNFAH